jgi:hypothetical protein
VHKHRTAAEHEHGEERGAGKHDGICPCRGERNTVRRPTPGLGISLGILYIIWETVSGAGRFYFFSIFSHRHASAFRSASLKFGTAHLWLSFKNCATNSPRLASKIVGLSNLKIDLKTSSRHFARHLIHYSRFLHIPTPFGTFEATIICRGRNETPLRSLFYQDQLGQNVLGDGLTGQNVLGDGLTTKFI